LRGSTVVKRARMKRTVFACAFAAVISPRALAEVEKGCVELKHHKDYVCALAFSADGKLLASGSADATVAVWDAGKQRLLAKLKKHRSDVTAVTFHPQGLFLATGDVEGKIVIWNLRSGKPACELKGHTQRVTCMVFSPDVRHLFSTSGDGTARLWFLRTGTAAKTLRWEEETHVTAAAFSPDGKLIAIGRAREEEPRWMGVTELWDAASGKLVKQLTRDGSVPEGFAFSADGRYVQAACGNGSAPLWEIESGEFTRWHDGHKREVRTVVISPDARHFLTGSTDGCAKLWDLQKGEVLKEFRTLSEEALEIEEGEPWPTAKLKMLFAVAFSPDCGKFVTGGGDGVVRVWSLPEEFHIMDEDAHKE
jgi:WD40 repeat protein